MNISLTKFAKDTRFPKSTVHRRALELGIDCSNGLDESAVALLSNDLGATLPQAEPATPAVSVEVGNHQMILASPTLPTAFTLEGLRNSEAVTFDDPLAVASQFLAVADHLTAAMQQDITQRQAKLQATQQAKTAIAAKADELRLEQRLYQLQTAQIDNAVSSETQALQDALAKLSLLGKPAS